MTKYTTFMLGMLAAVALTLAMDGCAALTKVEKTIEDAPVKTACFEFQPPVKDARGALCDTVCVSTAPPAVYWRCAPPPPAPADKGASL